MITVIPSEARHHQNIGWLDTRWHFSFSDYYDPNNMSWGPLRVFNDDIIAGGGGFPPHPHRDMEIITYVLSGELEHQDSLGNTGRVRPGEIQVMSAGKGIVHSEYNASSSEPLRLMQLWVEPRNKGRQPRWEQKQFSREERAEKLLQVVSSGGVPGTLSIDQDAAIYVASLSPGKGVTHETASSRRAYLFVIEGAVELNGKPLQRGDQARVADEAKLSITANKDAEIILLDLP